MRGRRGEEGRKEELTASLARLCMCVNFFVGVVVVVVGGGGGGGGDGGNEGKERDVLKCDYKTIFFPHSSHLSPDSGGGQTSMKRSTF